MWADMVAASQRPKIRHICESLLYGFAHLMRCSLYHPLCLNVACAGTSTHFWRSVYDPYRLAGAMVPVWCLLPSLPHTVSCIDSILLSLSPLAQKREPWTLSYYSLTFHITRLCTAAAGTGTTVADWRPPILACMIRTRAERMRCGHMGQKHRCSSRSSSVCGSCSSRTLPSWRPT
jgi:hypothetical protein